MLITSNDFTGKYKITTNKYTVADFNAFLTDETKSVLKDLMGVELFELFEADLSSDVPQSEKFLNIHNSLTIDYCGREFRSDGLKSMLKSICYFLFVRTQDIRNTISGDQKNTSSNSVDSAKSRTNISLMYNEGVSQYQAIQHYIKENKDVYPEFKGVNKKYISIA